MLFLVHKRGLKFLICAYEISAVPDILKNLTDAKKLKNLGVL
jgi:hypothetical protein